MNTQLESIANNLQALESAVVQPRGRLPSGTDVLSLMSLPQADYSFELRLASSVPPSLSKGKMFSLNVKLKSIAGLGLAEHDSFRLQFQVYTSENPPQLVTKNKKGAPILEFDSHSVVIQHQPRKRCHMAFLRLRINEVTSHFPNSWVFVAIHADPESPLLRDSQFSVKPLVLDSIKVRAKKANKLIEESD